MTAGGGTDLRPSFERKPRVDAESNAVTVDFEAFPLVMP